MVGRELKRARKRLDHGGLLTGLAAGFAGFERGSHDIAAQLTAVELVSV